MSKYSGQIRSTKPGGGITSHVNLYEVTAPTLHEAYQMVAELIASFEGDETVVAVSQQQSRETDNWLFTVTSETSSEVSIKTANRLIDEIFGAPAGRWDWINDLPIEHEPEPEEQPETDTSTADFIAGYMRLLADILQDDRAAEVTR